MDRINILSRQIRGVDFSGTEVVSPVATSGTNTHIKVYPPAEKHFATNPWERLARYEGNGGTSPAVTIPHCFAERVRHVGHLPALAQKLGARDGPWTFWTWNQYYAESQKVARALMTLGCEQFQAVNILAFNASEWFFTAMGSVMAGLTPAGIYGTNGPDGVEYIMNHSKARCIFVDNDLQLQKALTARGKCLSLKAIVHWGRDCPADNSVDGVMSWKKFIGLAASTPQSALDTRIAQILPDNACYLSYTSGTTGNPKAVMYSHDNITWSMKRCFDVVIDGACGFGLEEREVSYMPLSHIAGNLQLLGALTMPPTANSCVYFAFPDAMQGTLVDTLRAVRPTHFMAVPRVWEKLLGGLQQALKSTPDLEADPTTLKGLLGLEQIRASFSGAAPIAREIMDFFDTIGMQILEIYGMTENTAYSHWSQRDKRVIGSVGPALSYENSGAKIEESSGEICTWSRGVMMGYMYMPEKTAETFDDEGYLRTGDIGEVRDGFTFITGRIKEMIITAGGENMAPVLLEHAIKERLPALSNVVMIGDKQKYLIALMTLKLEPDGKGGFTDTLAAEAAAVDPDCKTFADAQKSDIWKAYLANGIEAANTAAISRAQTTRKYTLLPGDFAPVGVVPELTPTMKLRREVIHNKYIDAIRQTYADEFMPL